jgi:TPR repeat protein
MLAEGKGIAKNEQEGIRWIKVSADQGLPEALFSMGSMFYFGKYGQAVDYRAAYPYFYQAAGKGHPDSQNFIGVMLENGQGVGLSDSEAEAWFEKAARQGNVKAQANLGRLIGPETADPARRIEALTWLTLAAAQGEITAQKLLDDIRPGIKPDELLQAEKRAAGLRSSLHPALAK